MAGIGIAGGVGHFEDPSYFSEPEFDSEYQHQHIHKSKVGIIYKNIYLFLDLNININKGFNAEMHFSFYYLKKKLTWDIN